MRPLAPAFPKGADTGVSASFLFLLRLILVLLSRNVVHKHEHVHVDVVVDVDADVRVIEDGCVILLLTTVFACIPNHISCILQL
jgi:hypothetical protein